MPLEPRDLDEQQGPDGWPAPPVGALLPLLQLRPGLRYLELGCGSGACFFQAFESMQGQGVFLAAELQEERLRRFLNRLEAYAEHPGYTRIEVVRAKPDRLPLPDQCADRVLLSRGLPLGVDPRAYARELYRLVSPGGRLCLSDLAPDGFVPAPLAGGLLDAARPAGLDEAEACAALQAAGFRLVVSHAGLEGRWCLTALR